MSKNIILKHLERIEERLKFLQKRTVDHLTEKDLEAIDKARKEYAEGRTVSWEQVKKSLQERGVHVGRHAK